MNWERLQALRDEGLATEGLGPEAEWHPVPQAHHQVRHSAYWDSLTNLLGEGYGDDPDAADEDLPWWMSERATQQLERN